MWTEGLLLLLLAASTSSSVIYRLCVLPQTPSYHSSQVTCDKLSPTPIRCVIGVDRLDCLKKINSGEADLAVFEAEDLLITADYGHLTDVLVTHRIHASDQKKWEFAVVALVSNKANISKLSDLKGKRLCHPGNDPFATNYDWSEVFSLYFERRVAPKVCEKDDSIEENRIKALADFFGESCKPGVWAADPKMDAELKMKYKSLCGLCDIPSVCSQGDKYWGRQGALFCLSDCLGDVAWSMLKDARMHFNNVLVSVCSDVSLLCPDGSSMPLNSTDPCIWVTRPVPVLAAKRTKAEEIQTMLREVLRMPDTPDDFIRLLEANVIYPPIQLKPSLTPNDYLATAPGFLSANTVTECGQGSRAVTLCVTTLEDKTKCDWLSAVSKVYGVEPSLSCLYGANCLVSVANKSADFTITNTDKLLPATRHNLKPLLVHVPVQLKRARTLSAVVKTSSKFKKIADLKGKKACFSTVEGMGWASFVMHMLRAGSITGICPYSKAVSQFFSEICVSEVTSTTAGYSNIRQCTPEYISVSSEIYDQEDSEGFSFNHEAVAFECLAFGGGDVAFISTEAIPKYLDDMKLNPDAEGLTVDSFRPLCEGDSTKDCHLSWSSFSQVLVHRSISASKEEDVLSLLTAINNLFGHYNTPSTRTFNMFASTNSLFSEPTNSWESPIQRLEQYNDFIKKAKLRPMNFEENLKSIEVCVPSNAPHHKVSFMFFIVLIVVFAT